jgi:hypothetical protein
MYLISESFEVLCRIAAVSGINTAFQESKSTMRYSESYQEHALGANNASHESIICLGTALLGY